MKKIQCAGNPLAQDYSRREFLYADDLAEACIHLLGIDDPPSLVNIGAGSDITIQELSVLVSKVVGYTGKIINDVSKPDGTLQKLMDSSLIYSLGWTPSVHLKEGLGLAYRDFLQSGSLIQR